GVVDFPPGVVEKSMRRAGVGFDLGDLFESFQGALQPLNLLLLNPAVFFPVEIKKGGRELFELGVGGDLAVERNGAADLLGAAGERERIGASDAKTDDADLSFVHVREPLQVADR